MNAIDDPFVVRLVAILLAVVMAFGAAAYAESVLHDPDAGRPWVCDYCRPPAWPAQDGGAHDWTQPETVP